MKPSNRIQILKAAEELIQKRGVNDVSFQEISEVVGIRKASLFHYFSNKEELICELIGHCQEIYGKSYDEIALGKKTAFEKLTAFTKTFEQGLEGGKACLVGMLSAERESLQPSSQEALEQAIQNTLKIIEKVFEQGKKDKSILCNSSPKNMSLMFLSFLQGAQLSARAFGGKSNFRKMSKAMLETLKP